jgi:pSer/pThr/pTyr-binding forkhead associated (FHA) protein
MVGNSAFRLVGIGVGTGGTICPLPEGQAVVIGRDPGCTIVLLEPTRQRQEDLGTVSRHHAVIEHISGLGWCVYDAGSTNGTAVLVGGLPPARWLPAGHPHPLHPGDIVEIAGSDAYQFRLEDAVADDAIGEAPRVASR